MFHVSNTTFLECQTRVGACKRLAGETRSPRVREVMLYLVMQWQKQAEHEEAKLREARREDPSTALALIAELARLADELAPRATNVPDVVAAS